MDNKAKLRVGTAELNVNVHWRIRFVDAHLVPAPTDDMVWINIGRTQGEGIVNYRVNDSLASGSAQAMVLNHSAIFSHLMKTCPKGGTKDQPQIWSPTIVFDRAWKPDDAVAFFLLKCLLQDGELPQYARELGEYMARARRGAPEAICPRRDDGSTQTGEQYRRSLDAKSLTSAISLYLAMLIASRRPGITDENRLNVINKVAESAHEKIAKLLTSKESSIQISEFRAEIWREFDMARVPNWHSDVYPDLRDQVEEEISCIDKIVEGSKKLENICTSNSNGQEISNSGSCIYISGKKIKLHDSLILPMLNAGLLSTVIRAEDDNPRLVVLHDKDAGWFEITLSSQPSNAKSTKTLSSLGRRLEEREQEERGSNDLRKSSAPRFADIPNIDDPWYDGRDHNYSLVASPRWSKSQLNWEIVLETIQGYYWLPQLKSWDLWILKIILKIKGNKKNQEDNGPYVYRKREGQKSHFAYPKKISGPPQINYLVELSEFDREHVSATKKSDSFRDFIETKDPSLNNFSVVFVCMKKLIIKYPTTVQGIDIALTIEQLRRLARPFCGPVHSEIPLTDKQLVSVGEKGIIIWSVDEEISPKHQERWTNVVMDMLCRQYELKRLVQSTQSLDVEESFLQLFRNRGNAAEYLERFVDILKSYQPEQSQTDEQAVCRALEEALSIPTMIKRLEGFLQFSDERQRLRRDGFLNYSLFGLAVLAVIQIPAGFIQAWTQWEDKDSKDALFKNWTDALDPTSAPWYALSSSSTFKAILISLVAMFLIIGFLYFALAYSLSSLSSLRRSYKKNNL